MAPRKTICNALLTVILLLVLCSVIAASGAESNYNDNQGSHSNDAPTHNAIVIKNFDFEWTRAALPSPGLSQYALKEDIESVHCTSDLNCTNALPGLEIALSLNSDIPSAPYCSISNFSIINMSHCTCGPDLCVSYSHLQDSGEEFYYCGPCGYVGSQCTTTRCTHELAKCKDGYCECIQDGVFYEIHFCYISFISEDLLINVIVVVTGLIFCCVTLAYGYHKLRSRRQRSGSFYSETGGERGRRESPSDDTPPTYDDVVEKLPSYQDALKMSDKDESEDGANNKIFELNEDTATPKPLTLPPSSSNTLNNPDDSKDVASFHPTATLPVSDYTHTTTLNDENSRKKQPTNEIEENDNAASPNTKQTQENQNMQPIELLLHNSLQTQSISPDLSH